MITRSMERKVETQASQSTNNDIIINQHSSNKRRNFKVDLLSNLPDALILHILSYIDTKLAVMTCVLSKRWRHLWEYLPGLNMFSTYFRNTPLFEKFISQFVENHKARTVYSLSFHSSIYMNELSINRVIEHVVSRHVQHVLLEATLWNSTHNLASRLLSSKSLRSLKLENCIFLITPFCLNFPSLKTLSLSNVNFYREEQARTTPIDVFSSCESLENLELSKCAVRCWGDFIISCHQLVNLKFSYALFDSPPIENRPIQNRKMIISAPRLASFKFENEMNMRSVDLSIDNSPSLHVVDFHITNRYRNRSQGYLSKLLNLFTALRTAKSLSISMETIEILSTFSKVLENQIFPFDNLEIVEVKAPTKKGIEFPLKMKRYLVSGSPNAKGIAIDGLQKKICWNSTTNSLPSQ